MSFITATWPRSTYPVLNSMPLEFIFVFLLNVFYFVLYLFHLMFYWCCMFICGNEVVIVVVQCFCWYSLEHYSSRSATPTESLFLVYRVLGIAHPEFVSSNWAKGSCFGRGIIVHHLFPTRSSSSPQPLEIYSLLESW